MVTAGEAAAIMTRWFVLVMGNLTSSLDGWRVFQYLSLVVLRLKEDSPLVSAVLWWFVSTYVAGLMKAAVRRYKVQKLAQDLADINSFLHTSGPGLVDDRLYQLAEGIQEQGEISNLLGNEILEPEAANNNQLVTVLGKLGCRARELQQDTDILHGYWFAVLYVCTALATVMIIRLWIGPPPSYGSPENYKGLPIALILALVLIVHKRHPIRWDQETPRGLEENILEILTQPVQEEQPRLIGSILDANQVAAVTTATHNFVKDNIFPVLPISRPRLDSSDSDGGSSRSSDDETINSRYASVHSVEAGVAHLIAPNFIEQLQEMTRGLLVADAVEKVRTLFRHAQESGNIFRLSDIIGNQWILHSGTETFGNPPSLTYTSIQRLVMVSKITTKLSDLIWLELDGQNWQLCQEVKKEFFLEVVGQSVRKLLEVVVSFSKVRWPAGHYLQMLTLFNALINDIYSIRDLPLNRYELIYNEVAYIFGEMVKAFERVIDGTADVIHGSDESTIHPATVVLVHILEFFHRNREMMQHLLRDSEDYNTDHCYQIFVCWVRKLKKGAEIMFPFKGQTDIFILNDLYFVLQNKFNPGVLPNLESEIKQYTESYLVEYWVPLVRYLHGEAHRSSLDKFTENFDNIRRTQMTWKVRTQLKKILRDEIVILIVAKYANFLDTMRANPSSRWRFRLKGIWRARSKKPKTAPQVETDIRVIFEG